MLTAEQLELIKTNRLRAQRLRLDSYDAVSFTTVPAFIVEALFLETVITKNDY
jgi:hypothetical protein